MRICSPGTRRRQTVSKLKITLVRSTSGRQKKQKLTVASLGLRRINQTVIKPDNPAIRGMVEAVRQACRG